MNGKILIDTNVIVRVLAGDLSLASFLNEMDIFISCISAIEILSNPMQNKEEIKVIKNLISNFTILENVNPEIQTIASNFRRRKQIKKTPDAIIAATAMYHNIQLLTFDTGFEKLKEIEVILFKK